MDTDLSMAHPAIADHGDELSLLAYRLYLASNEEEIATCVQLIDKHAAEMHKIYELVSNTRDLEIQIAYTSMRRHVERARLYSKPHTLERKVLIRTHTNHYKAMCMYQDRIVAHTFRAYLRELNDMHSFFKRLTEERGWAINLGSAADRVRSAKA